VKIAVGIATAGRPGLLEVVIRQLSSQTRHADLVIACAPSLDDIGTPDLAGVYLLIGPRGLTQQRNAILDRASDFDVIVFFDDDFLPESSYLEVIERVLTMHPDIVMVTGCVVADGIIGPGLAVDEARRRLAMLQPVEVDSKALEMDPVPNGYGCNMAVRMDAVAAGSCRFDERLPLYGWLEDVDFSGQLARVGRIVKVRGARGIHLGVKRGRQSGIRLGYSQIANPIYLLRKGTCPWPLALRLMSRNISANFARSIKPEPYIDRRGRLVGNCRAFLDCIEGRLIPERILEL
jgi:hypothetical protein